MSGTVIARRTFCQLTAGSVWLGGMPAGVRAQDDAESTFTFGVIADAQYCDAETTGSRFYRRSLDKLAACVDDLNEHDPTFVIHLGDFIDRDFSSFDAILPIYSRLKSPRYHALGNHDFSVAADKKGEVAAKLGLKDRYYSFRVHGWRFVVLDGNDVSLISRGPDEPEYSLAQSSLAELKAAKAPNAQNWNGGLSPRQLAWLDRQLSEADDAGERVVVFCHFPVYPSNAHNLWNDTEVVRVLESHPCVAAYMSGHNHAGLYAQQNGIHYVTFRGMVETKDTTAYALVQVQADQLRIQGRGRVTSRVLDLRK